jgi:hypothetical protein
MLVWAGPDTASRGCATRFGAAGPTPSPDSLTPAAASSEEV